MGLLSRVAFMQGKSSVPDPLDTASSSSTASCDLDFAGAPTTPVTADAVANDCGDGPATAAAQPKYWPSQEEVAAVLAALGEEDRGFCDAAMANRYLRATGGDRQHAAKRVHDTLTWQRAEQPDRMVCTACRADHKSHYMQVVGHDRIGRPLIYSCLALATNRDVEDNRKHMISTFEQAIRLMPQAAPQPGSRPVESWCWVLDFHGFSVRDCDPRLAKIFLNLSAAHYPERLGTFFVVSAPSVFNTLWRAISHFIDPVTKQKIHFVNFNRKDNSKLEGLLGRYFDGDTTAWLLQEMADNRDKGLALSKAYSYPDLSKLAAEGRGAPDVAEAQAARRAKSSCRRHDHLGSPAFLESLEGNPDLLLPHLKQLSLSSSAL
ncbi:Random slug 5 [Micractinium conductrix]|uniref:Random slug 5 n=1 Tax=Micractinium conductrix TaxID=554055 RepID=A0A2P6VA14_9CHLO|nr:Random slug 5 [Micractinium conductrix]|eukprot:PSC70915.1 Random slug 5 [Micractinium conductrix]